jgi:hypothetical protein
MPIAAAHPAEGHAAFPAASSKPGRGQLANKTKRPRGGRKTVPAAGSYKEPYDGVDRYNPVAVGEAFALATYTFHTATQASANPATARSTRWCTPSLKAKMLADLPQGSPGGQWMEWRAHKAVTAVAVRWAPDSGAPPETPTAAYESYGVTVTPRGEHGWTGAPDYYVLWVTLTRSGPKGPWEVANFEVQPWLPARSDK